jgi:hypothetical protein
MTCRRCGSPLTGRYCSDATCPFDGHAQACQAGWAGHPEYDPNSGDATAELTCDCLTDKHEVVRSVEAALERSPKLLAQFRWLLKVWNTDDDRLYEEFDPTQAYGARYSPADD